MADKGRRPSSVGRWGESSPGRQMGPPVLSEPSTRTSTYCSEHEDWETLGHKSWQGQAGGPGSGVDWRHSMLHTDSAQAGYEYPCASEPAAVTGWAATREDCSQEPTTTEEAEDRLPRQLRFPSWCAQNSTSCWEENGILVSRSGHWRRRKWVLTTYPPAEEDEREWRLRWSKEKMLRIVTVLICLSAVCSADLFTEDGVHITREGSSRIIESVWTALVVISPPPTIPMRAWVEEVRAHYELPMEKKVPWNGAVSMRSRAGSWETLSICITLRHNQGAPADMHANALGILIICRFPLA